MVLRLITTFTKTHSRYKNGNRIYMGSKSKKHPSHKKKVQSMQLRQILLQRQIQNEFAKKKHRCMANLPMCKMQQHV